MCPSPLALPTFKVAIGCRGAALAGLQNVGVHAQAHGAPRLPPVETRVLEYPVEPFLLGLTLYRPRPRHHHGVDLRVDCAPFGNLGGNAQVLNPGVGAGADEGSVYLDLFDCLAGLQAHVVQGPFRGFLFRRRVH